VVLSIFFAGISGSSTADAASQSKIFIEAQRREGYDDSFSVAITAVSAVLAVIIPPSILMIACSVAGMRMVDALRDTCIMLLPMLGVLAAVILFPQIVLFLPGLISPEFLR
jgi:TRAP-type C4-dicarboxylate transport system permease large subunit